jgi:hypothetical protein
MLCGVLIGMVPATSRIPFRSGCVCADRVWSGVYRDRFHDGRSSTHGCDRSIDESEGGSNRSIDESNRNIEIAGGKIFLAGTNSSFPRSYRITRGQQIAVVRYQIGRILLAVVTDGVIHLHGPCWFWMFHGVRVLVEFVKTYLLVLYTGVGDVRVVGGARGGGW